MLFYKYYPLTTNFVNAIMIQRKNNALMRSFIPIIAERE